MSTRVHADHSCASRVLASKWTSWPRPDYSLLVISRPPTSASGRPIARLGRTRTGKAAAQSKPKKGAHPIKTESGVLLGPKGRSAIPWLHPRLPRATLAGSGPSRSSVTRSPQTHFERRLPFWAITLLAMLARALLLMLASSCVAGSCGPSESLFLTVLE